MAVPDPEVTLVTPLPDTVRRALADHLKRFPFTGRNTSFQDTAMHNFREIEGTLSDFLDLMDRVAQVNYSNALEMGEVKAELNELKRDVAGARRLFGFPYHGPQA